MLTWCIPDSPVELSAIDTASDHQAPGDALPSDDATANGKLSSSPHLLLSPKRGREEDELDSSEVANAELAHAPRTSRRCMSRASSDVCSIAEAKRIRAA